MWARWACVADRHHAPDPVADHDESADVRWQEE